MDEYLNIIFTPKFWLFFVPKLFKRFQFLSLIFFLNPKLLKYIYVITPKQAKLLKEKIALIYKRPHPQLNLFSCQAKPTRMSEVILLPLEE